ncbi:MAG: hypothetical protein ACKVOM_02475 [Ferruginibacter sp.]
MIANALFNFAQKKGIIVSYNYCKDLAWEETFDSRAFLALPQPRKETIVNRINTEKDPNGHSINIDQNPYFGNKCL